MRPPARIPAFYCLGVLVIILTAGLWPFRSPRNNVSWSVGNAGLRFEKPASVFSAAPIGISEIFGRDGCSLEIRLAPKSRFGHGTFFAVYNSDRPHQFSLRQFEDGIVIGKQEFAAPEVKLEEVFVPNVFQSAESTLITVASDKMATVVYSNGVLAKVFQNFSFSASDLAGTLIVGDSGISSDSWNGKIVRVAIYDERLLQAQHRRDYYDGVRSLERNATLGKNLMSLFEFDEGYGNRVHNRVPYQPNLYIPDHYKVLHKTMLEAPWDEFRADWGYKIDVMVNIVGFVPLGFCFFGYFSTHKGALGRTAAIGALTSLVIELLQAYLPTRSSGVTDLMTNTLGACLGGLLFQNVARPTSLLHVTISRLCGERIRSGSSLEALSTEIRD